MSTFRRRTRTGLVRRECGLIAFADGDPFEPDFAPPQMDAARTEYPPTAIKRLAADALQDHRRCLHLSQLACLFVYESFNTATDAKDLSAERHELRIERETPVRKSGVQRRKDFLIGSDPHQVTRPKTQIASGRGLTERYRPLHSGERDSAGDGLDSIVQPASWPPPSVAESKRSVVVGQIEKAACYLPQCAVA